MNSTRTRRRAADRRSRWVRRGRLVGLLAATLFAAGLTAAPAHADRSTGGSQLLDVVAHDDGPAPATQHDFFTLNTDQLKAGLVEVRLHDAGTVAHQVQLLRLHDGVTASEFSQQVAASHGGAALQLADATGGSNAVDPGGYQATFVNLRAGNYVALCFLDGGGDGAPHFAHGMMSPFTVESDGEDDSGRPPSDVRGAIDAFSFGFRMPAVVEGHGLYRFKNTADRDTHELAVLRLLPNKTAGDYLDWIKDPVGAPPAVEDDGGGGALAPHGRLWVQLNLRPGNYVAVCFVPDDEGSHPPHAALGMVQGFRAE